MHDRRPLRASRAIALLFALSLVLTACDSEDVLALLQGPVADDARPAAAAPAGERTTADRDRTSRGGAAENDAPRKRAQKRDGGSSDGAGSRTASPAPPAAGDAAELSAIEQEIVTLLGAARRRAGLTTLRVSADVARGARSWSCRMADTGNFRHADLRSAGVLGENIAWGQRSAEEVHNGWMNSSGHRANRMSARWSEYGVGVCRNDDGRLYFTERFR